jgi:hypothetical protein
MPGGDRVEVEAGGSVNFKVGSRIEIAGVDKTAALAAVPPEGLLGVAAGYKLARGQHTTVAAVDTVVTGLATVVAVVAVLDSDPTLDPLFVTASIGDQAGAPAAGSVYIKSWQATAAGDVTPIAATTFGKKVNWIAIGT